MSKENPADVIQNSIVLANAAALASAVIISIGEQNISRTLNNQSLTRDRIEQLALARLNTSLVISATPAL